MKMKSKITMGLGLLFLLVFVISGLSIFYLNKISIDEKAIIKDNYKSLGYVAEMTNDLNAIAAFLTDRAIMKDITLKNNQDYQNAFANFDRSLLAEENNITEPGERELAYALRAGFNRLTRSPDSSQSLSGRQNDYLNNLRPVLSEMNRRLTEIHSLNMKAILRKNEKAKASSDGIIMTMSVLTAICMVMAVLYYFYFPNYVSFALMVLSERMKDISTGKYDQRLNLRSGDEFEDISDSFDLLLAHLQEKEKNG